MRERALLRVADARLCKVTERHYMAKEVALKRVIQSLSAERDSAMHKLQRLDASTRRRGRCPHCRMSVA